MPQMSLENVRKTRPLPDGRTLEILKDLSLRVCSGSLTAIIGPSGSGKSTLIRLLNRLEDAEGGRILLDGVDIRQMPPLELRQRVVLMPQKPFIYAGTVLENLQRPFLFRGQPSPPADSPQVRRVMELSRLPADLLERRGADLSLGQQQRLALARAMIVHPEVLLLDEPTSALDRPTGDLLAEALRQICRKEALTVLMVTHDLRLAERAADRLAYLEDGRILEEGSAADLFTTPRTAELTRFLEGSPPLESAP